MSVSSPFSSDDDPQLVIYDLDGTLVDSVPSLAVAVNSMLQSLGRDPWPQAHIRQWVGNGARVLVARALSGTIEVDPELDEGLLEQAHGHFLQAYQQCATDGVVLYPGVQAFLQAVQQRGIPQAIVTNKPVQFVPRILQAVAIEPYFFKLVGGDCLTHKKPHPEPILHVLAAAGVTAERALMVGDSINDITAAQAARVPTLGVTYGYNHGRPIADSRPDWVVDSLAQLLPF